MKVQFFELYESEVLASTSLEAGSFICCKDSTNIYMIPTSGGKAVKMAETTRFLSESERLNILTPINGKKYFCFDTGKMWIYYNEWICINPDIQTDWDQTDNTAADFIKNKPDEDDALALISEISLVTPITSSDGVIYTDENDKIYVL